MTEAQSSTSQQQTLFALSYFSNLSAMQMGVNLEGVTYARIQEALEKAKPTIGAWRIVWGPSVIQLHSAFFAVNTMYVAQSVDDPTQYVIAIAGTNPYSAYDWLFEDCLVGAQVPWIYAQNAPDAKIALGTASGFSTLLRMTPSGDRPGAGTTLKHFLKTITGTKVSVAVAGHSLGGVLAPTVALWLRDMQGLLHPLHWDRHMRATVSCFSTAGPTAGNSAFATHSYQRFGTKLDRIVNPLDVVPCAWNQTTLATLKTIYAPAIAADQFVDVLVELGLRMSKNGDYAALQASAPIQAAVNPAFISPDRTVLANYLVQAGHQHEGAYINWARFDRGWLPTDAARAEGSALATLAQPVCRAFMAAGLPAPFEISALRTAERHRLIPVGLVAYEAPHSAGDPEMQQIVADLKAEMERDAASAD